METTSPASELTRKQLNELCGGLILMTVFTAVWIFIAEVSLHDLDHGAVGGAFGIVIVYFIISYIKLAKMARSLPKVSAGDDEVVDHKKSKTFYIIFVIEGIAIFVAKNVLLNTGHDNFFIPTLAMIVGLHFFPLGKLLNRTFYYVLGSWMCLVAVIGFGLIYQGVPGYWPNPVIGIGCAIATVANGIRLIRIGGLTDLGNMI